MDVFLEKPAVRNHSANELIPDVSVVVPIYNEVESLPQLIEAIVTTLKASHLNYEIICVDDGSTDGSGELLRQLVRTGLEDKSAPESEISQTKTDSKRQFTGSFTASQLWSNSRDGSRL